MTARRVVVVDDLAALSAEAARRFVALAAGSIRRAAALPWR